MDFPEIIENGSSISFFPSSLSLRRGQKRYVILKVQTNKGFKWNIDNIALKTKDDSNNVLHVTKLPLKFEYK
jgi:hypothetical protein